MKKGIIAFLTLALFAVCCNLSQDLTLPADVRYLSQDGTVPERLSLEQGWSDDIRNKFWFTSQGSQIMPYSWFTWLEQPGNSSFFRNTKHMSMLGYIPMKTSKDNPSGLPVGFAMTTGKSAKDSYVGFTCAACHTNQIDYKGNKYLIDGAPTLANFVMFFDRIVDALHETHENEDKFNRFALRVLGNQYTKENAVELRQKVVALAKSTKDRQTVNALPPNYPKDFTSFGRLDAFTNIENAGSAFALGDLSNKNAPTAPVSYPFLWGTHQSDFVQWNASAANTPVVGPLVRNVGEVVGVFGGLTIGPPSEAEKLIGIKNSYNSNVDFHGLGALEGYVKTLRSPRWKKTNLPPIDPVLQKKGKKLYIKHCADCHQVIPFNEEDDHYKVVKTPLSEVGTDVMTSWSIPNHMAKSLSLEGSKADVIIGDTFGETTAALSISVDGVIGLVLKNPIQALEAGIITSEVKSDKWEDYVNQNARALDDVVEKQFEDQKTPIMVDGKNIAGLVYKARPLNGIWATAPYLHNGSVPNLWQLLQKEADRATTFWVGSHIIDPVTVGFLMDRGKNEFKVKKSNGSIMPGNSNAGHTYGTKLPDDDKWALIEYMKSI